MLDNDEQIARGNNINQAGRDIIHGVSPTVVKDLLNVVYDEKVKLVVSEYMHENMKKFSENLLHIIDTKTLSDKILSSPDLAFIIDKAIKVVGEKGNSLDMDVLLKLLESRINSNDNTFINIVTEQSIKKIDKITNEHISLLTLIHIVQNIKFTDDSIQELDNSFNKLIPLTKSSFKISDSSKKYLASLGLIEINVLKGNNTKERFFETYSFLDSNIKENEFIKLYLNKSNLINIYDMYDSYEKLSLYQVHLTTVGEMIALANLKKTYSDIDISKWIN